MERNCNISLRDFRGFQRINRVAIRPITVLVGENSAGKTSFLAAVKFVSDFLSANEEPSFNSEPFQLGTFDQIAHYRGGRIGRAQSFNISYSARPRLIGEKKNRTPTLENEVTLSLEFKSFDSQASINFIRISYGPESLEVNFSSDGVSLYFVGKEGSKITIEESSSFPKISSQSISRYWPFLFRDLRFRFQSGEQGQKDIFDEQINEKVRNLADIAGALFRRIRPQIYTSAAIRTRPERTYTPGTEKIDGEGSHVPFEVARLYRARSRTDNDWQTVKQELEKFGNNADMFSEIKVKSFGKSINDPFQIQFSRNGPSMNMVDLGYGTSQVLPILYTLATAKRGSKIILQQPEVHLHAKAQAALAQYIIEKAKSLSLNVLVETHSDFIVDRIRNSIQEKIFSKEDISLLFFERGRLDNSVTKIELDSAGEPIDAPKSYREFFRDEQLRNFGLT